MTDLVKRLRDGLDDSLVLRQRAADYIEKLEARQKELLADRLALEVAINVRRGDVERLTRERDTFGKLYDLALRGVAKSEETNMPLAREVAALRESNAALEKEVERLAEEVRSESMKRTEEWREAHVIKRISVYGARARAAEASNLRMTEELNLWGPIAAAAVRFVRAKHEDQEDAEDELRLYIEARRKRIAKSVALAASPPKGDADV